MLTFNKLSVHSKMMTEVRTYVLGVRQKILVFESYLRMSVAPSISRMTYKLVVWL